ncbi:MAG: hypothetical protein J7454_14160 [Roseiflexus sp.]|jgi:hypothetical protein|nr:hypothetical protein [Roseiflexus sp.]
MSDVHDDKDKQIREEKPPERSEMEGNAEGVRTPEQFDSQSDNSVDDTADAQIAEGITPVERDSDDMRRPELDVEYTFSDDAPVDTAAPTDLSKDPYYLEPYGPNDREANFWNTELQHIRDHPGGAREEVRTALGWESDTTGDNKEKNLDHGHEPQHMANTEVTEDTADTAYKIAHGHAFEKHKGQFDGVETPEDLQRITQEIMDSSEPKQLRFGRTAYWSDHYQAVVIVDPSHPDVGTIFKPNPDNYDPPKSYYDKLK